MSKKVFYCGFGSSTSCLIMDYLSKDHGWEPAAVISMERIRGWVEKNYKNAVFRDVMSIRKGQFDYAGLGGPVPVDAKIIAALAPHEATALRMIADPTGWNFSFEERHEYYHEVLKFCNTLIVRLKPDVFASWTYPHIMVDYVLYQLCRYYKVPVLFTNPVPTFNHGEEKYNHIGVSLEDQSLPFKRGYESDKSYELSDDVRAYFQAARVKQGMPPPYIVYFLENMHKKWNITFWKKWARDGWRLSKRLVTGKFLEKIDLDWKVNRAPIETPQSKMNYMQYILFRERLLREDPKLKNVYASFVRKADLNRKYIYYAAHLQPEAGVWTAFGNQFLVLDLLSASLPEGWVIYYKEHPSQFLPGSKGSLGRSRHYYEKISRYKNVQIIPHDESTFKLIDSAQAVATLGGTVGWEAIVRGKPSVIFSPAWYQACDGVLYIESLQDCLQAMAKVKNGYKPDSSKVDRFSMAVAEVSGKNMIHGDYMDEQIKASPDPKHQMKRMADLYHEAYERYYCQA